MGNDILMDVQHLSHIFRLNRKVEVHAVDDVSFQIKKGEIYGLVGESGSGKSTVARCVMNIYKPSAGEIYYKGIPVCKNREFKKNRKMLQMTAADDFPGLGFQPESGNESQRYRGGTAAYSVPKDPYK